MTTGIGYDFLLIGLDTYFFSDFLGFEDFGFKAGLFLGSDTFLSIGLDGLSLSLAILVDFLGCKNSWASKIHWSIYLGILLFLEDELLPSSLPISVDLYLPIKRGFINVQFL